MIQSRTKSQRRFGVFAALVLLYNLPVILWGAYVRVSFSGDGCGANWPTCNGQYIPHKMATPMAIEFTHRMMTTLDTCAVLGLVVWAFFAFPRRHAVRVYSLLSFAFLAIEALLGAGLVLFRYVAKDQSTGRVWYLSAHLTNTMLLLAALTTTAWLAAAGKQKVHLKDTPKSLWFALAVTIFISITGTITALGDTLFPASSLSTGMQQDFASSSSFLLRLRVIHPAIALMGAAYLVWVTGLVLRASGPASRAGKAAIGLISISVIQLAAGLINLVLLAPFGLQLTHLLLADLVWIAAVLLLLEAIPAQASAASAGRMVTPRVSLRAGQL